jgi:hypothetical protein
MSLSSTCSKKNSFFDLSHLSYDTSVYCTEGTALSSPSFVTNFRFDFGLEPPLLLLPSFFLLDFFFFFVLILLLSSLSSSMSTLSFRSDRWLFLVNFLVFFFLTLPTLGSSSSSPPSAPNKLPVDFCFLDFLSFLPVLISLPLELLDLEDRVDRTDRLDRVEDFGILFWSWSLLVSIAFNAGSSSTLFSAAASAVQLTKLFLPTSRFRPPLLEGDRDGELRAPREFSSLLKVLLLCLDMRPAL